LDTIGVGAPSGAEPVDEEDWPAAVLVAPAVRRRPHVFAVLAHALPLRSADTATIGARTEVALLMTPGGDTRFDLRTPRGTIDVGMRFVLRCASPTPAQLLVRAVAVSALGGMRFDLVTARIEHPIDTGSSADTEERAANVAAAADAARRRAAAACDPRLRARPISQDIPESALRACVNSVQVDGATSIGPQMSVTLRAPVRGGEPIIISAPRNAIRAGGLLALRYFDASGARRGIMRVATVRPSPGMVDEIAGALIGAPTRAPERQSYRAPLHDPVAVEITSRGGRAVIGQLIDISAGGIGVRFNAVIEEGDRIRIVDRDLPELDGAELVIVRRDPRDPQRYGARFLEQNRGATTLLARLDLGDAERIWRRRVQIEEIRHALDDSAGLHDGAADGRMPNERIRTRWET
jgi:hypothetical protein